MDNNPVIIVYTKPDCPLCQGLIARLQEIQPALAFTLELREDLSERVPRVVVNGRPFPQPHPRLSPARLKGLLAPALAMPARGYT